jgi:hypothetical protein
MTSLNLQCSEESLLTNRNEIPNEGPNTKFSLEKLRVRELRVRVYLHSIDPS